ncbi:salicylate hydroxylase [Stachybotrys elegans]|uniref:Salicylate hydroxylase n=1 Tax=Stachybotrys elegans TaxID=80388 RepID=A0A8K0T9H4_9HYPO|nr:salicylate hydroxylase [Stachybotrys elegans]
MSIRIAIIGGGIAGATLANALVKHVHLDVHVYESAPEFSERGAGIGLSYLALGALETIIPSAIELFKKKAGAVAVGPARIVIGSGPNTGAIVSDISEDSGLAMNRAPLLKTLLESLPPKMLHANKKLSTVKQEDSGVVITFEDGSMESFDAVVGADGLFSTVRQAIVGVGFEATPAGWWDCRNLLPLDQVKARIGEESFEVDREFCWVGDEAFMMHAVVENGTKVQCIIAAMENDPPKTRKRSITRETLENALRKGWLGNPVATGMVELMLDQADPQAYSIWEHRSTPCYARGRLCIVGDAAHATSPWQGAGASLAVEDCVILGHLLGQVASVDTIEAAFRAFDIVRRPRCQGVIDTGLASGQLFCGQNPDVGLDSEKMGPAIGELYTDLDSLDITLHMEDASKQFKLL